MTGYEEITIRLPDGYAAYARYWQPRECRGSILYLHGIQSHAGWFETSAKALCDAGYAVLQPDRRGSGRNHQARGHADSAQQLIDDSFACLDALEARLGHAQHHLLGISWGGKLVVAMHATDGSRTAGLIPVTPGLFPIINVSATQKFRIGLSMLSNPTASYPIPLNDPELFTRDPAWMQFLRDDPLQIHEATAGFFLASRRMDRIAAKLPLARGVPLHLMLAADERIIDNELTRRMMRDLHWPNVAITTYEHARHTLEFDSVADGYLDDLVRWLNDPASYVVR